jgi:hypothetical protein
MRPSSRMRRLEFSGERVGRRRLGRGPAASVGRARYASRMRRALSPRALGTLLAITAAFGAGAATQHLGAREAHAQAGVPASITVPAEGLVFRSPDGRPIARVSRDARGGVFELYDDRQEIVTRVPSAVRAVAAAKELHPNPYVVDDEDPFASTVPGPGF